MVTWPKPTESKRNSHRISGIQLSKKIRILSNALVLERYLVLVDRHISGIGIGIGKEVMVVKHR